MPTASIEDRVDVLASEVRIDLTARARSNSNSMNEN
jgi:hypothetical protein